MKRKCLMTALFTISLLAMSGCGRGTGNQDELNWLPSDNAAVGSEEIFVEEENSWEIYEPGEIAEAFIDKESTEGAHMVWANQNAFGIAKIPEEILSGNMLTYYFSSSEGDDSNNGRTPGKPKKTLTGFTDITGINLLFKCGDTFPVESGINIDTAVNIGSYGQGRRPVLDYRRELQVDWEQVDDHENLWKADFADISDLHTVDGAESNGNIGQMWIDGECSFLRVYHQEDDPQLFEHLNAYGEGYFYIDTMNNVLYLNHKGDPAGADIRYSLPDNAMNVTGNNVRIQGVEIMGAGFHGISMVNAEDVTISCCYIHHVGGGLLYGHNVRFGNAVQLWDNGRNINVTDNVTEWIYDTALTNQTTTFGASQNDLTFAENICRFSFWGIESWGDHIASEDGFQNVNYVDNALMYICDPTSPDSTVLANNNGQTLDDNGKFYDMQTPYLTCRGDSWPFHQMSAFNAAVNRENSSLTFSGNVCWDTRRCMTLLILGTDSEKKPLMENNTYYCVIPTDKVCLYRYTDHLGAIHYVKDPASENDFEAVSIKQSDEGKYKIAHEALERVVEAACR